MFKAKDFVGLLMLRDFIKDRKLVLKLVNLSNELEEEYAKQDIVFEKTYFKSKYYKECSKLMKPYFYIYGEEPLGKKKGKHQNYNENVAVKTEENEAQTEEINLD